MVNAPEEFVTAALTTVESFAASTRTEAWISPSLFAASTTLPRSAPAETACTVMSTRANEAISFLEPENIIRLRFFHATKL